MRKGSSGGYLFDIVLSLTTPAGSGLCVPVAFMIVLGRERGVRGGSGSRFDPHLGQRHYWFCRGLGKSYVARSFEDNRCVPPEAEVLSTP